MEISSGMVNRKIQWDIKKQDLMVHHLLVSLVQWAQDTNGLYPSSPLILKETDAHTYNAIEGTHSEP